MRFKQFSFRTLKGGQGERDSSLDFLGAAAWVAFGSIMLLLGLLASVVSLVEDIFEIYKEHVLIKISSMIAQKSF